ncbi:MAG: hypothetical protein ACR2OZ_00250 [Verrucomicrobiales bacterium]
MEKSLRQRIRWKQFLLRQALTLFVIVLGATAGWWLRKLTGPEIFSETLSGLHDSTASPALTRPPKTGVRDAAAAQLIAGIAAPGRPSRTLLDLRAALARNEVSDFAALARNLLRAPFPSLRNEGLRQVMLAWAAVDPAAAIDFLHDERAARKGSNSDLARLEERLSFDWAARDAAAALKYYRALHRSPGDWPLPNLVSGAFSQGDPVKQMKTLSAFLSEGEIASGANVGSIPKSGRADSWRDLCAQTKHPALMRWLQLTAVEHFMSETPDASPKDAVNWMAEKCMPEYRDQLRGMVALSPDWWKRDDLIKEWRQAPGGDWRRLDVWGTFGRLCSQAPEVAAEVMLKHPDIPLSGVEMARIADKLGAQPKRLADLLESQAEPSRRNAIAAGIANAWNIGQPVAELVGRARGLGETGDAVMAAMMTHPRRARVEEAHDAFLAQPVEFQAKWGTQVAAGSSEESPKHAADVLLSSGAIARNDLEAAVAAEVVVENFMRQNSLRASEWVGTLPAGAVRDRAVLALVRGSASADPETAAQWAASIHDENVRAAAEAAVREPSRSQKPRTRWR